MTARSWKTSRFRRGEKNPRATVTDRDVALAIQLVEVYGLPCSEVAAKFEVTTRCVQLWVARSRRAR